MVALISCLVAFIQVYLPVFRQTMFRRGYVGVSSIKIPLTKTPNNLINKNLLTKRTVVELHQFDTHTTISTKALDAKTLLFCTKSTDSPLNNFFTLPGITNKKKEYVGKKVVGYTMEQMFEVVSDVENYRKFVPFCIRSDVTKKSTSFLSGKLEVGFPPIVESYTSHVALEKPHTVRAICRDGKLFNHLATTWKFHPGIKNKPNSCTVHFYLSFEFKSMLHSQLANVFFDEMVKQMESAFVKEAERRFGSPSLPTMKLT